MRPPGLLLPIVLALAAGCPTPPSPPPPADRPNAPSVPPIALVGDVGIVPLSADGWDDLTPSERLLAWHLSRAVIAGDPIAYDQRDERSLEVKLLLEGIARGGAVADAALLARIREYLRSFWIHHGTRDAETGMPLPAGFGPAELRSAALSTFHAGIRFDLLDEAEVEEWTALLAPALFAPPRPPDEGPRFAANLRDPAITEGERANVDEFHRGSARLARTPDGTVFEEVYRAGREGIPPGLYAPQLRRVAGHLRDALPFAEETQRAALERLIDAVETGAPADWRAWEEAWAAGRWKVDLAIGFLDRGRDPEGTQGIWAGLVCVRDDARADAHGRLAEALDTLLEWLPPGNAEPTDTAAPRPPPEEVRVLATSGEYALLPPTLVDLPQDAAVRTSAGSRRLRLLNVEEAIDRATTPRSAAEFAADEAEAAETIRCALPGGRALAVLRGFVGPEAADPAVPESADDPGEPAGVLAEAWSDLAALHLLRHPLLVELGLLPDEACATAVLRDYVRGTLASLRNSPDDGTMPDALRARLLNVGYAVERGAVRVERSGARTVLRIPDPARWYEVAAERMRSLERIRAGADDEAGRALVEAHGARAPAGWREEAARRALLAGLPPRFAFLPPWLDPVRDERGEAVDARATAPTDLEPLMFSWSAVGTD